MIEILNVSCYICGKEMVVNNLDALCEACKDDITYLKQSGLWDNHEIRG